MATERMPGWRKTARAPYWRARSTHKFRFVPLAKAHFIDIDSIGILGDRADEARRLSIEMSKDAECLNIVLLCRL